MNAPTPREQELEAQNKALWELVGECEKAGNAMDDAARNNNMENTCRSYAKLNEAIGNWRGTLAAIQKAKESMK